MAYTTESWPVASSGGQASEAKVSAGWALREDLSLVSPSFWGWLATTRAPMHVDTSLACLCRCSLCFRLPACICACVCTRVCLSVQISLLRTPVIVRPHLTSVGTHLKSATHRGTGIRVSCVGGTIGSRIVSVELLVYQGGELEAFIGSQ